MPPEDPKNTGDNNQNEGHGHYPDTRTEDRQTTENYLSFMVGRARKIASALYLITDTMEETEPLRLEVRSTSVMLVSKLSTRTGKSFAERRLLLEQVEEVVEKLVSFLEIGATSRLISEMNAAILREQLSLFLTQLTDDRALLSDSAMLPLDFLKDNDTLKDTLDSKGHNGRIGQKDTELDDRLNINAPYPRSEERQTNTAAPSSYESFSYHNNKPKSAKPTNTRIRQEREHQKRREKIVSFITRKKEVTIKDITGLFKDIGEKTIQRELSKLVADGTIEKRGEKRWSKYLIAPKKRGTK